MTQTDELHSGRATPTGVRLALPGDWWLVPLDPSTRHQQIAELVDARLAVEPRMAPVRNELIAALRRTAREAADQGAVLCGSMAMSAEDSALSANVVVLVDAIAPSSFEEGVSQDLSLFQRTLQETLVDAGQVRGGGVTVVELPQAGAAVRVAGRRTVSVDIVGHDVEVTSVQYFVPMPGSSLTAIVTFTSPALQYEEALVALFDAVAGTFGFTDVSDEDTGGVL